MKTRRTGSPRLQPLSLDISPARVERFRKTYALGDRLTGALISEDQDGFAWVEINNLKLLAKVPQGTKPGDILSFYVSKLYPTIVLKLFSDGRGGSSLAQLVEYFLLNRKRFEQLYQKSCSSPSIGNLQPIFSRTLFSNPDLMRYYIALLDLKKHINEILNHSHSICFSFIPWMLPTISECDILFPMTKASRSPHEYRKLPSLLGFYHAEHGPLQCEIYPHKHPSQHWSALPGLAESIADVLRTSDYQEEGRPDMTIRRNQSHADLGGSILTQLVNSFGDSGRGISLKV